MQIDRAVTKFILACVVLPLAVASCASKSVSAPPGAQGAIPTAYDFTQNVTHAPVGVYADPGSKLCCFVGPSATIPLAIPSGSTNLNIAFYQLERKAHPSAEGTMVVRFDGKDPVTFAHLVPGFHTVSIPIPKGALNKHTMDLDLTFPTAFVPKDEGMGGDTRLLSVVLRTVEFTNETPPNRYEFDAGMASGVPDGVFADGSPATCCFVGASATLPFSPPASATKLNIAFYEPALPAHPNHEGTMIVSFDGRPAATIPNLNAGYHLVTVPLPAHDQGTRPLTVGLRFLNTFVPSEEKLGKDTRVISIVLRKVYFQ